MLRRSLSRFPIGEGGTVKHTLNREFCPRLWKSNLTKTKKGKGKKNSSLANSRSACVSTVDHVEGGEERGKGRKEKWLKCFTAKKKKKRKKGRRKDRCLLTLFRRIRDGGKKGGKGKKGEKGERYCPVTYFKLPSQEVRPIVFSRAARARRGEDKRRGGEGKGEK